MELGTRTEFPVYLVEKKVEGEKCMFMVNPKAINILSGIRQPVLVVAFAGSYQTEKTEELYQTVEAKEKKLKKFYIMKKLIGPKEASTLKVDASIHTESKGIKMWCVPHPHKKNHTLVLLDTVTDPLEKVEKEDNNGDLRIFTLAVLLSSALVYDSDDTIDQYALEKLTFLKKLNKFISVRPQYNNEQAEAFRHFPIFIWTVKNIDLELNITRKLVSKDDFLEETVKNRCSKREQSEEDYDSATKPFRQYFKQWQCFVFDKHNKHIHQRLEELPDSELNPKFVDQCQKLCDYIHQNAEEKKVHDGFTLTGQRLAELAENYANALNSSNTIRIEKELDSWYKRINTLAVQEAMDCYEKKMNKVNFLTQTLDDFMNQSKECEEEAWQMFLNKSVKGKDQEFLHFVKNICQARGHAYLKLCSKNKERFMSKNNEFHEKHLKDPEEQFKEFQSLLKGNSSARKVLKGMMESKLAKLEDIYKMLQECREVKQGSKAMALRLDRNSFKAKTAETSSPPTTRIFSSSPDPINDQEESSGLSNTHEISRSQGETSSSPTATMSFSSIRSMFNNRQDLPGSRNAQENGSSAKTPSPPSPPSPPTTPPTSLFSSSTDSINDQEEYSSELSNTQEISRSEGKTSSSPTAAMSFKSIINMFNNQQDLPGPGNAQENRKSSDKGSSSDQNFHADQRHKPKDLSQAENKQDEEYRLEKENIRLQENVQQLNKDITEQKGKMKEKLEELIKEKEREMNAYMDKKLEQQATVFQAQIDELKKAYVKEN